MIETKCTGGPPPTCCQPPMSEAERRASVERIDALIVEIKARMPRHCGSCGSRNIVPLFWTGLDVFGCVCGAVMSGRGD